MNDDNIKYAELPDYPGYRVGNDGSVWTSKYAVGRKGGGYDWILGGPWKKLSLRKPKNKKQYTSVTVTLSTKDKVRHTAMVSRLILTTFRGPPPTLDHQAAHEDNDPTNNNIKNLRWDTRLGNMNDQIRHGTRIVGSARWLTKLNEEDVVKIVAEYGPGNGCPRLGKKYGVNAVTIRQILLGETWAHTTGLVRRYTLTEVPTLLERSTE